MLAIVTGAGSGVGAATARKLIANGYRVAVFDRDGDAAVRTAHELGDAATAHTVDVADLAACRAAITDATADGTAVDILVNSAGAPHANIPVHELNAQTWTNMFDVNVLGVANMVTATLPDLTAPGGTIVNVTSVAGVRARTGLGAYCASKAAAISLTKTLALELAPRGIRVNSVAPGSLETPMFEQFLRHGESMDSAMEHYLPQIPLGRRGEPSEIADAILWVTGPQTGFVTGQNIVIDGGRSL